VLASRLSGHEVDRVLLDVSPYSFGPSYLGERDGEPYPHCYLPIIRANTPLPITRTEKYWTAYEYQTIVEVNVYQGDDPDALKNIPVGTFHVEGLTPIQEPNEVLCRMKLDLDGILQVTAIEKMTGRSKQITISNALEPKSESELAAARNRLQDLFSSRAASADDRSPKENGGEEQKEEVETPADVVSFGRGVEAEEDAARSEEGTAGGDAPPKPDEAWLEIERQASKLVERSRALLPNMHDDDKEEAIGLHENIETAIRNGDFKALAEAAEKLKELLFFIEGR
jgi:molecular chaperone DnaK (HSP70)